MRKNTQPQASVLCSNGYKIGPLTILLVLIFFHLIANLFWMASDDLTWGDEVPNQLISIVKIYNQLKDTDPSDSWTDNIGRQIGYSWQVLRGNIETDYLFENRPSVLYLFSAWIGYLLNSNSLLVFTYIPMSLFLVILICSVFLIGEQLGNSKAGLIAATAVSFFPALFASSRRISLDYGLTAMVALSFLFLIRNIHLKNVRQAVALGLSCGFGILIKGQFILFLAIPLAWVCGRFIVKAWISLRKLRRRWPTKTVLRFWAPRFINLSLVVTIALIISSVWWKGNLKTLLTNYTEHLNSNGMHTSMLYGSLWNFEALTFYPASIPGEISYFFLIVAAAALVLITLLKVRVNVLLWLWFIVPLIIFTLTVVKWDRYIYPILPVVGITIGLGFSRLGKRMNRPILVSLLITALIQFCALGFGAANFLKVDNSFPFCHRQSNYSKAVAELVEMIPKFQGESGATPPVGLVDLPDKVWEDRSSVIELSLAVSAPTVKIVRSEFVFDEFSTIRFLDHAPEFQYLLTITEDKSRWNELSSIYKSMSDLDAITQSKLINKFYLLQERIGRSELLYQILLRPADLWLNLILLSRD